MSKIPIFNHTFYLISCLIFLSMAPIRRSNRAPKPRVYWDPTNTPSCQRQQPAFTIYTEPPEHLPKHLPEHLPEHLSEHLPEGLLEGSKDLPEGLFEGLSEGLSIESSDEDLSFEFDEDLSSEPDEALSSKPDEVLSLEPNEDLSPEPNEDLNLELDEDLSEHLSRQLHEGLGVDLLYQPQFLSKDRVGKPQNLPEIQILLNYFSFSFQLKK